MRVAVEAFFGQMSEEEAESLVGELKALAESRGLMLALSRTPIDK